jgi:hypothetical protein
LRCYSAPRSHTITIFNFFRATRRWASALSRLYPCLYATLHRWAQPVRSRDVPSCHGRLCVLYCSSEYAEITHLAREQSSNLPNLPDPSERAPKGDPHRARLKPQGCALLHLFPIVAYLPFLPSSPLPVTSCSTYIDTPDITILNTLPTPLGSSRSFTFTFAIHPFE